MEFWAEKYIGRPWTREKDCFYWFRKIQETEFNRDCPQAMVNASRRLISAARIMAGDIRTEFGYMPTTTPSDGDAAFLSQRTRPHHIGTVALIQGNGYILHGLEGVGVILSDVTDLALNGWKIQGYWTWK